MGVSVEAMEAMEAHAPREERRDAWRTTYLGFGIEKVATGCSEKTGDEEDEADFAPKMAAVRVYLNEDEAY